MLCEIFLTNLIIIVLLILVLFKRGSMSQEDNTQVQQNMVKIVKLEENSFGLPSPTPTINDKTTAILRAVGTRKNPLASAASQAPPQNTFGDKEVINIVMSPNCQCQRMINL